ncbi:hypothetical protein DEO72_LG11g3244 [Vigna unguiculata]|uniref:Uncharacterized protein n=1 Tax=Vigna unguiculata TaxID=3917 RepID=A0A4D6NTI2_VIGUN|nr:hypothetical protein DEO72_LG11g3244 [Vigna unguiculata]
MCKFSSWGISMLLMLLGSLEGRIIVVDFSLVTDFRELQAVRKTLAIVAAI